MYKPGNVENIELMIYFSPENFKREIFNNLKRCESENMKKTLFYLNKYFYGKCLFFSLTCSSNSADVDDDYVVDGDTDGDE